MNLFGYILCVKPVSTISSIAKVGVELRRNIVTSCVNSKCYGQYGLSVGALSESKKEWQTTRVQLQIKDRQNRGFLDHEAKIDHVHMEDSLFDYLCETPDKLSITRFKTELEKTGLRETDHRLKESMAKIASIQSENIKREGHAYDFLDRGTFKKCIADNIVLIAKAFREEFVIPDFSTFCRDIDKLYEKGKSNTAGAPASYIPQLARFNPNLWGVSVCTVDGQRYSIGDTEVPSCLQSVSKAMTYALVLSDLSSEVVHQYVGQEPSGQPFNMLCLNANNKPHNPMINAGAIVTCSLLKKDLNLADRFDFTNKMYKRMAGNEYMSFNNSVFLSERETADRNFALGYYMRENKCFPKGTNLIELLDFYFQCCSAEITCESGAVIAATLANGGICPTTGDKVLQPAAIRDTLSLMLSCGMYDYSGQFAFKVGLPAKSGVSGGVMLVVPNVMGIYLWSPPLDQYGNSSRGIQFCENLVSGFNFHNYDNLNHTHEKRDPRVRKVDTQSSNVVTLLFSAFNGDVTDLRRCAIAGMDMSTPDYDGRTALHIAAAEGHLDVIKFLLNKCKVSPFAVDRWGFTALDDAKRFEKIEAGELLLKSMQEIQPDYVYQPHSHD
ncbi:glutaminase kidney isoform, mitochondrial-like isoform X2 [Haliotis rubra]|uniref:glutaminase kidney isoform, mitochondrial-like isoform X2 n=1 Tax=Haliotis rubra TaxID=36100 RepID=UPI001EE62A3E|nr:glutaminase kidney isoform, mitochondrial-like isoform X2 [Haliotis rubra]